MKKRLVAGVGVLVLITSSGHAQTLNIDHQPVGCAVAEKFPRLEARFAPAESVAVARVVFQGQSPEWYSVAMKPEGAVFVGVLPKPKKSLKSFRYYLEVTDKALATNRTADYTSAVVDSSSACKGKIMAGTLGSASVILQGPAGLAALPAGFASTGVVAGSAAGSGSAGAAGASAAAGGGGLSTGAVVGIVGGVGAAAAGVAVAKSKSGDDSVSYTVNFESNSNQTGIGLVECGGTAGLFFSSQGVTLNASGSFDTVWGSPALVRAVGQAASTTFQATMTCLNGARSGSLSATGSPSGYSGTFEFGNSRGPVTVTRR